MIFPSWTLSAPSIEDIVVCTAETEDLVSPETDKIQFSSVFHSEYNMPCQARCIGVIISRDWLYGNSVVHCART